MILRLASAGLIALIGWLSLAEAQESASVPAAERQAVITVIQAQLDAFARSDHVEAFSYASPRLRRQFGTPENFIAMVKAGYLAVYRPQSYAFLETWARNQGLAQAVHFVGPDGAGVIAIYTMQRQADGSWRIAAVHLLPASDLAS